MAFTITGTATDLDLDLDNLPRLICSSLVSPTMEDGTVRVHDARGAFDAGGALTKDDGGSWLVGAPEHTPMLLRSSPSAFPPVRFDAPADGASVDLAALLATLPVMVPSASHPFVKGDTGDTGRGVDSITDTDGDGTATVTYTDATTDALPLPRGIQGIQGVKGDKGDPGTTSIDQDTPTGRIYWTGA